MSSSKSPGESQSQPLRNCISFGVEIEMTIADLESFQKDPDPEDRRKAYGLFEPPESILDKSATFYEPNLCLGTRIQEMLEASSYHIRAICYDDATGAKHIPYDHWHITRDISIHAPDEPFADAYSWSQTEIVSPAFYLHPDSFTEIEYVCAKLKENYRIVCSDSCGLHVHIGFGKLGYEGWSLEILQKLMAILWVLEPQIMKIHPQQRRRTLSGENGETIGYNLAMRSSSLLGDGFPEYPTAILWMEQDNTARTNIMPLFESDTHGNKVGCTGVLSGMQKIFKTESINDLSSITQSVESCAAYKLTNIEDRTKPTVEFRQHRSTLDFQEISAWVNLLCAFVTLARDESIENLMNFLGRVGQIEDDGEPLPELHVVLENFQGIEPWVVEWYRTHKYEDNQRLWSLSSR